MLASPLIDPLSEFATPAHSRVDGQFALTDVAFGALHARVPFKPPIAALLPVRTGLSTNKSMSEIECWIGFGGHFQVRERNAIGVS